MAAAQPHWTEVNQRETVAALVEIRAALEHHAAVRSGATLPTPRTTPPTSSPPALETLCSLFGLSRFERATLLACAAPELDSTFGGVLAAAHGDTARPWLTFGLALAALPEPHWSALAPTGPLRRWRLLEVAPSSAGLTGSPIRIDERILHFLAGVQFLDERLTGYLEPVLTEELAPSHRELATRMAEVWKQGRHPLPALMLTGADMPTRRAVAAQACAGSGVRLHAAVPDQIPSAPAELENFVRLWGREAALLSSALYVDTESLERTDGRTQNQLARLLDRLQSLVIVGARDPFRALTRPHRSFDVSPPTREEQRALWQSLTGIDGDADRLVGQFNLGYAAIRRAVDDVAPPPTGSSLPALWAAGREQTRPRLDDLAQRVEPSATFDDLVLPDHETSLLRQVVSHVHHRATVYDKWGFRSLGSRGLGISTLFAGSSGTGKTMAAEVMAHELALDLYRIDLSSVVSKYIGETEKNLRRVFDAAEQGGAILFFDEADALFGKRSEVKDSHDRYANVEVNYLLQRMETYRGLAVLATNMKSALDPAFLRRIRFVINFPFPDQQQRAEIWRRIFPASTPCEPLDIARLSRLNLAGGNIRNVALHAAFHAAQNGGAVTMKHVLDSVRGEFAKIEKPYTDSETGGWS